MSKKRQDLLRWQGHEGERFILLMSSEATIICVPDKWPAQISQPVWWRTKGKTFSAAVAWRGIGWGKWISCLRFTFLWINWNKTKEQYKQCNKQIVKALRGKWKILLSGPRGHQEKVCFWANERGGEFWPNYNFFKSNNIAFGSLREVII